MRRRPLLWAVWVAACGGAMAPGAVSGQPAKQPRRIGLLAVSTAAAGAQELQALRTELRGLGQVEGRDITIDTRYASGHPEDLPGLAAQLGALKPHVIVALGPAATRAALASIVDVPVVTLHGDLLTTGLVGQLSRPGGRLTGVSIVNDNLNAKRLELLSELLPKGSAVLNLGEPSARGDAMQRLETAGRSLGIVVHAAYAQTPPEIDVAFATARRLRVAGINVLSSPFLHANRKQIIELAADAKLPAIYQWRESAEDGGLLAYGPNLVAIYRPMASLVVHILDGASAGDLPIEQPMRFDFVINMKTAKALGLAIPQLLLLRADEVIR